MVHAVAAYTQSPSDEASLGVFNPTPPPPPNLDGKPMYWCGALAFLHVSLGTHVYSKGKEMGRVRHLDS